MAVDELTCGQGGSNGQEIIDRINELTKLDPRGSMRLASPATVTITDDVEPALLADAFDTIVTERGGLAPDILGASITNNTGHDFTSAVFTIGLNVIFPASETLEVYAYINDVQYSNEPLVITGDGNGDPREAFWQSEFTLAQGDKIDIRGRNRNSGSYDLQILRSTLRLDVDWKETMQVAP